MTRNHLVVAALAVMTTVLTACGGDTDHGTDHGTSTNASTSTSSAQSTTAPVAAPSGEHNDADITFAQGMIPHHEGAIVMARLAPSRTSNAQILDLASRIEKAQDPEIKTMTAWLNAWGTSAEQGGSHDGHDGHGSSMPGMSDEDTARLEAAKGADFDRAFLELMIEHHQGAVDMSTTLLGSGRNADAKKLAEQIISAQQAEITEMEGLLKTVG
ncbi:DUF305 domain-containing protein [Saccharothrix sp. NRRL B-16314]|uniref:DUF305 domain-containing protein n=1 Tax=Saccharothrix sp. NRRL B-16314 TaxID=1463825 RepID=UPI000525615A|nr:DUF305 domain-containing protein [Saccharothrix sp. NRRL B-16314]